MSQFVSIEDFNALKAAYEETADLLKAALTKIKQLESAIFAHDDEGDIIFQEDEPVISPALMRNQETIIESDSDERETFIPKGKLQNSAIEFIKFICSRPVVDGVKAITPSVLHQFRKHVLPEQFQPETDNPRQWKKELTDFLGWLFPGLKTEKKGDNRGKRLIFPGNFNTRMLRCKLGVS